MQASHPGPVPEVRADSQKLGVVGAALDAHNVRDTWANSGVPQRPQTSASHEDCLRLLAPGPSCCYTFRIDQCACRSHWLHSSLGPLLLCALCRGVSQLSSIWQHFCDHRSASKAAGHPGWPVSICEQRSCRKKNKH